ncbi:hypothetical protein [Streptomyces sp. NBRC 110465]|uniref:hypothetical protein n=1 Tax=Streptomyces sp. NBRC 110465 TaxID=1897621 RepID=UPI00093312C5|nr:hypothetical protein [Streptomyces sp. NBRC 110465]
MFAKLRRRRPATPAPPPAPAPRPAPTADPELPARVARLRTALLEAGLDLAERSAAEPAWFSTLRAGNTISLSELQQQELTDHLAGIAAANALDDAACARALDKIEAIVVLGELRAEGIVFGCSPASIIRETSAANLRQMAAIAREADEEGAPPTPRPGA